MSLRFLDRLLPNVNVVPSLFWFPLGLPCLQVDPMAARKKGDLVLYSGDLFPTEARKPPSCPRSHTFRKSKGEAYSSISSSRRSVRFYEASKHSSLALINQELCRHSLRLPVYHTLLALFPTLHTPSSLLKVR